MIVFPGCGSCGLQGKKAWNTAGFESSNGCNYRSLLGKVSYILLSLKFMISCWSSVYFTNMILSISSESWKRPSFSSIMESLKPLTKSSPVPQSGHGDMPLLTWKLPLWILSVRVSGNFFSVGCLAGLLLDYIRCVYFETFSSSSLASIFIVWPFPFGSPLN